MFCIKGDGEAACIHSDVEDIKEGPQLSGGSGAAEKIAKLSQG